MGTWILLLLALAGSWLHPDSRSSSLLKVQGSALELELRFQARSILETLPLDLDGDGLLDARELTAGEAQIAAYVLARYEIVPSADWPAEFTFPTEGVLSGKQLRIALVPDSESALGETWVVANYSFSAASIPRSLGLRVRLFREQNPFHRDEARLEFQQDDPARHLFSGEQGEVWRYRSEDQRRAGIFADYWREGVAHIRGGFDHLAFVLGLLLAARNWRSLLGVVTAFTLAHSIALVAAVLGLVHVRSVLVEMAIALSISYLGALNLLSKEPGSRWVEALVFGLVHGLGFAGAITDALVYEPLRWTALFGFNFGVECGQIAIVLPLAIVAACLPGERGAGENPRAFLTPSWLRKSGSALVLVAGLYWFGQRAGWW
jgi:hydrogenase/urease accessory protein HupE